MTTEHTYRVDGLCCEGCELTVEQALLDVAGVKQVRADASRGTVDVRFDADVSGTALADAIREAGFGVE